MSEISNPLRSTLERLGPISDDAWIAFSSQLRERHVEKDGFFAIPGVDTPDVGFITEGVLRMYYIRSDGREFNKSFLRAGDICGVLDAPIIDQPSRLYIGALVPSTLLTLPKASLEELYDRYHCWAKIGRRFAEMLAIKKMRREESLLLDSAEQRYRTFRLEYAQVEYLLRDYHIASYLGITPVALSRIKKRLTLVLR